MRSRSLWPRGVQFKDYDPREENFRSPNFVAVERSQQALIKRIEGGAVHGNIHDHVAQPAFGGDHGHCRSHDELDVAGLVLEG